jgi:hypothetical protein
MNLKIKNIKEQIIIKKLDFLKDKWNYYQLSYNEKVPFKFILNNLELPWDFTNLSGNKKITFPAAKYSRS